MIEAFKQLATDPKFWEVVGITLFYCGAIGLFAWLGQMTAERLQRVPTDTKWRRILRNWKFWFIPAGLLMYAVIGSAMANAVILGAVLVIPYAYFTAVGIYREGRA